MLVDWKQHETSMDKVESLAFCKLLGSMKRLEQSRFTVNKMFWLDEEDFGD